MAGDVFLKIAFLGLKQAIGYFQIGGAENFIRRLSLKLLEQGHDVDYLLYGSKEERKLVQQGISLRYVKNFGDVLDEIRTKGYDHIITTYILPYDRTKYAFFRKKTENLSFFHFIYFNWPDSSIKRMLYFVDVVDNRHFVTSDKKWQPPEAFPRQFFLTVTRLSPEKNLMRLLKAFAIYRDNGGDWGLVIVGTGPMGKELKENMTNKLTNVVFWYGWAHYNDLPSIYHSASCFILPSISEAWGLVVNEAMAAGLPVLVSRKCGCVPDLCRDGINGFSFDPLNVELMAELMLRISSKQIDKKSMGEASQKIIADYTPEKWAATVVQICKDLLKS